MRRTYLFLLACNSRVSQCLRRHLKAAKVTLLGVFDLTKNKAIAPTLAEQGATAKGIVLDITPGSRLITPDALKAASKICPWVAGIAPADSVKAIAAVAAAAGGRTQSAGSQLQC